MRKTCFVIMGFHTKKIPNTNICVNLDMTYKYLIKPVLIEEDLVSIYEDNTHIHAYRCDEMYTTQAINSTFIRNLYIADIVIADITTLNQNCIYELGMRHAMKPKSTIIMCDKETLNNNRFFDLTFTPQIIYDSTKQTDINEIQRVSDILKKVIQTCKNSDETYVDSPVFSMRIYDEPYKFDNFSFSNKPTLKAEIINGKELLENENYEEAENVFLHILTDYNYISDDIVCCYVLASYKKKLSIDNLNGALKKMNQYISLDNTTFENALGIAASIHLKLFKLTKEPYYLYTAIELYRRGSNYESGNIYCAKNYCSTLLKVHLIESNVDILKEYYYTAKHLAKVFLTQSQSINRKSDLYNNAWFIANQADLLLISNGIKDIPFNITNMTKRQRTTISDGRKDLLNDLSSIKEKIGIIKRE